MSESVEHQAKKPSQKQAIQRLQEDILGYLESSEFKLMDQREQAYALFGVLIEAWWENFQATAINQLWSPKEIKAPRFFLKAEVIDPCESKACRHAQEWLKENVPDNKTLQACLEAGMARADAIRTEQDLTTESSKLFAKRLSQGLSTSIENSFKFVVLIWNLLTETIGEEAITKDIFITTIQNSQSVLTGLATNHLAVASFIQQFTELGDLGDNSGPVPVKRNLEGFDPDFFILETTGNSSFSVRPKTKNLQGKSISGVKEIILKKAPAELKEKKPIGCPALHLMLIRPFSTKVAEYFWSCLHTKSQQSPPLSEAAQMLAALGAFSGRAPSDNH